MSSVKTKIIFLNGASNSGKNSIATQLQEILNEPFLHIGIENFVKMMPEAYINNNKNAKEGFYLKKIIDKFGNESFITRAGYYGKKVITGMMYSCVALAQKGLNLIVDDVCYGKEQFKFYKNIFDKHYFFSVGVFCPIEELLKRESENWIAKNEIALQESKIIHSGINYDIEVDTSLNSSSKCAQMIKTKYEQFLNGTTAEFKCHPGEI